MAFKITCVHQSSFETVASFVYPVFAETSVPRVSNYSFFCSHHINIDVFTSPDVYIIIMKALLSVEIDSFYQLSVYPKPVASWLLSLP